MATEIDLGGLSVEVVKKDIKNIHLSVHPPAGRVRVSAPLRTDLDAIRIFTASKIGWIKRQQLKLRVQERESPREYVDRESHYVWGERYLLEIVESDEAPAAVELGHSRMRLRVRPGADAKKKRAVVEEWYRAQLKQAALPLIAKWEPRVGVRVRQLFVRRMKTKWGSCNPESRGIRLNTDLAKKPPRCLEYLVVHEMAHLLEPTHNDRYEALLDRHYPMWREARAELNELPLSAESWKKS